MSQKRLAYELHRPKRKRYPTRSVVVKGWHENWQADLVFMEHLKQWNRGYKYLLTVIDTLSKFAFARPLKSKRGSEITEAFADILKQTPIKPKHLHVDKGSEFYNETFKALMKKHGINMFHTYTDKKASIVERWNRTLKGKMYRYFTEAGTHKWYNILPKLVENYNNTKHRTIQMKPSEVDSKNEKRLVKKLNMSKMIRYLMHGIGEIRHPKLKVGDFVRLSREKHIFEKAYTENWTEEVFKLIKVFHTDPRTYKVADLQGEEVEGTFYSQELQKTNLQDYARIEKVLARKVNPDGQKMLRVRWVGYGNKFNDWIPLANIENIKASNVSV